MQPHFQSTSTSFLYTRRTGTLRGGLGHLTPRVLQNLGDGDASLDIAIEHQANQVQILFGHDIRYSQVVVHDLINAIEGILLVHNGVEKDSESPDVLLFAAIRLTGKNLWSSVICSGWLVVVLPAIANSTYQ